MKTDLAIHPITHLLSPPPAGIPGSRQLIAAYNATRHPHPDTGPPDTYPPPVRVEARRALDALRPFCEPVSAETLTEWLEMIPSAVRHPKPPEEVAQWLRAVALAVGHLEAGAFTIQSLAHALQTFRTFPSAADVYEIVASPAVELRQRARALARIAGEAWPR